MDAPRRITVYCASSEAIPAPYHLLAAELGERIARAGLEVVFGGGSTGLMGSLARAALSAGGTVRSVILRRFVDSGIALEGVSTLEVVEDLRPRKARLEELGDACIALPGGFGTFEELLETITRKQVGFHQKPIVIVNQMGFYDPLLDLFERAIGHGFVDGGQRAIYAVARSAEEALALAAGNGALGTG